VVGCSWEALAGRGVSMEAEEPPLEGAVTRQQLLEDIEDLVHAVVRNRVHKLVRGLWLCVVTI
jgi:hypothetical protein